LGLQQAPPSAGEAASDLADRFWWRSKEVLDTAYALEAALLAVPTAEFVIFLEDDIMLAPGFVQQLDTFLKANTAGSKPVDIINLFDAGRQHSQPIRVSSQGTTQGFAMHASMVKEFVPYSRRRFAEAPVDWLLNDFIRLHNKDIWVFYPNLVDHIGHFSSLVGKKQPLVSSSFADRRCWFGKYPSRSLR
jgi:GR25 family glycosyltransferase involved in LPS biosynthesis